MGGYAAINAAQPASSYPPLSPWCEILKDAETSSSFWRFIFTPLCAESNWNGVVLEETRQEDRQQSSSLRTLSLMFSNNVQTTQIYNLTQGSCVSFGRLSINLLNLLGRHQRLWKKGKKKRGSKHNVNETALTEEKQHTVHAWKWSSTPSSTLEVG